MTRRAQAIRPARKQVQRAPAKSRAAGAFLGRSGYEGARSDLRETMAWQPGRGSADQDILADLPQLRARTADLERNAPIAAGALTTRNDNVVGSGLMPTAQIDREYLGITEEQAGIWQRQAMRLFRSVAKRRTFDAACRCSFFQMQRLAYRSVLGGGDAFAVRRYLPRPGDILALKVQLLEADRVANPPGRFNSPTLRDGVALDRFGAPFGFWVASHHPSESGWGRARPEYDFIPARGPKSGMPMMLHIIEPTRVNQTRGVPYLAPVIIPLKQLTRFSDSELAATVISSFFTVMLEDQDGAGTERGLDDIDDEELIDLAGENNIALGQGAIVEAPKGKKVTIVNPGRPNAQFQPFVDSMASYIGVALGIPKELLLKQFNASYSAARAALQEAWRSFESSQAWLVECFCQPVYEWIISEAVERGLLQAPGFFENPMIREAYLGATWAGPTVTQLDPLKEVNAAEARIRNRLSSRATESQQLTGQDWEAVHHQLVREQNAAMKDGLPLEASSSAASPAAADQATPTYPSDTGAPNGNGP